MKKYLPCYLVYLLIVFCLDCKGQAQIIHTKDEVTQSNKDLRESDSSIVNIDTVNILNAPCKITRKIRKGKDGKLLFAAYEDIIRYDGESFSKIAKAEGFDSFDAFDVFEDTKENIWIASTHLGVFKYDGKTYSNFLTKDGLAHDRAMCIHEDRNGIIWIGTEGGISLYSGNSLQNFTVEDGLTNNNINTIMEDRTGKVWVGTRGTLCLYDPKSSIQERRITFTEFLSNDGTSFENVWSIVEDKKGNLWLGGEYGLWLLKKSKAKQVTDQGATGLYEDPKGNIWFTHLTDDPHQAGLSCFDKDSTLTDDPKADQIFIGDGMFFGISEHEGHIWIGTLNGVFLYDGKSIIYFEDGKSKG